MHVRKVGVLLITLGYPMQVSTGGRWSAEELSLSHHISFLELLAIFHGLKSFLNFSDLHVTVFSDNTTATAYINHMGGTHSSLLNFLTRCIWLWCKERAIWLSAFHIPGWENGTGNFESRNFNDNTEWTLNKTVFDSLCDHFGNFEADLFAARLDNQISNYISWRPVPEASGVDAFSLNWSIYFSCGFPLFCLLGRVMNKISSAQMNVMGCL